MNFQAAKGKFDYTLLCYMYIIVTCIIDVVPDPERICVVSLNVVTVFVFVVLPSYTHSSEFDRTRAQELVVVAGTNPASFSSQATQDTERWV